MNNTQDRPIHRRTFLISAGAAGAATLVGCDGGVLPDVPQPPLVAYSDTDILNFALNLEYLEAEFYLRAATGSGLSTVDAGTGAGAVTGGSLVNFPTAVQQQYAYEIAQNELNHVRFLRSALGSAAVARPAIDFTNGFAALGTAAGINGTFNPFADNLSFLLGAFTFEDVGVTAYHGAAGLIVSKNYLTAAAGILAVEAYHAAEIRSYIYANSVSSGVMTTLVNANRISALRGSLGGGAETALSGTAIVAADGNSVTYSRSTDQVLHIVYGAPGAGLSKGLFFPAGLNGTIKTTLV